MLVMKIEKDNSLPSGRGTVETAQEFLVMGFVYECFD